MLQRRNPRSNRGRDVNFNGVQCDIGIGKYCEGVLLQISTFSQTSQAPWDFEAESGQSLFF